LKEGRITPIRNQPDVANRGTSRASERQEIPGRWSQSPVQAMLGKGDLPDPPHLVLAVEGTKEKILKRGGKTYDRVIC